MREFIIQWNRDGLDLFEYTKEHSIIQTMKRTYAVDIICYIKNISRDDTCQVYIENCPIYPLIHRDLDELNIDNGICYDAENYQKHRWREKLPQMNYIAYWDLIRPPRIDELEEYVFDFDKWLGR